MTDTRTVTNLAGSWDFAWLGETDVDAVDVGAIAFDDRAPVPGCFDVLPNYVGRRGLAVYRTRVTFDNAALHRLRFDGVQFWCRVFVDGQPIGDHAGGFTAFDMDVTDAAKGERELIVLVDNRFDARRSAMHHAFFDWYQHGGIARGSWLIALPEAHIDRVVSQTVALDPPTLRVMVRGAAEAGVLRIAVDGVEYVNDTVTLGERIFDIALPEAALWSPHSPNLHTLRVALGGDGVEQRIGLRQVRVDGADLLINGQAQRLRGVCLHELHPDHGCALPDDVIEDDLARIVDLGCNFIRGTHYPMHPRLLDRCDELGICVSCEAIGWGNKVDNLTDPTFIAQQKAHMTEMVSAAAHHPSVIMWGLLNEAFSSDPEARPTYETLIAHLRDADPTRPITFATNQLDAGDRCLDLCDIVSINHYPGWYKGDVADIPAELDRIIAQVAASDAASANKPLILSELGAGAIPGWEDPHNGRWTETYQATVLEAAIEHLFTTRRDVTGLAIWQYCDVRTTEFVETALKRPRGFNNKGIVDEHRRPKLAYDSVRHAYRKLSE